MAKALSEDVRERVIAPVAGGMSRRAAPVRFGVAAASAIRSVRDWRATGATPIRPQGGDKRSHRIEVHHDVLLAAIERQVYITLVELAELLRRDNDAAFALSTIWRFLYRHLDQRPGMAIRHGIEVLFTST